MDTNGDPISDVNEEVLLEVLTFNFEVTVYRQRYARYALTVPSTKITHFSVVENAESLCIKAVLVLILFPHGVIGNI